VLAVEVEGLEKRYRGGFRRKAQDALRGVDLRIPAGAAFGLIGPNGAGKTTLLKSLLGVVHPTAGRIRLLGGDPGDLSVRARVGYLPERLRLSPSSTPLEILASVARLKGRRPDPARLLALLEEVGMAGEACRRVGAFSKGMRQRVGLAVALVGDPELLFLDEPTDGLDPLARADVRELLVRASARGVTVLLNSHLLSETERVCSRIGVLVAGRMVREGTLDEVRLARSRWCVRFAPGGPGEALARAGFTPDDRGRHLFEGDAAALNGALDAVRGAGALLVELSPESSDLEAVLAEAMEDA
jgi:ABC-2 type transport system ATP-binding protein